MREDRGQRTEDREFLEFEQELRKLRPAKISHQSRARKEAVVRRTPLRFLTHSLCILLGMICGGVLVHSLQKPVVVEKVVFQQVEPQPTIPQEKPIPRIYEQIPLDIDGMIAQYNKRSKLLANHPRTDFSYSSDLPQPSSDPNSLLKLRERMKL